MSEVIFLIDAPNLSYRNYHAMGGVTTFVIPTVYGLLRDLGNLGKIMPARAFVFCFDGKHPLRKEIYPQYKANRKNNIPQREKVGEELDMLREQVLPDLGYKNIFYHEQAEADDLIGLLCKMNRPKSTQFVIVSTDQDYNQLLNKNTTIWSPATKSFTTEKTLLKRYGLSPHEWVEYKAIIGDDSDNISGVPGVGSVRGLEYMHGEMDQGSTSYKKIYEATEVITLGKRLNTIPLPDLNLSSFQYGIEQDDVSHDTWDSVVQKYGLQSLIGKRP